MIGSHIRSHIGYPIRYPIGRWIGSRNRPVPSRPEDTYISLSVRSSYARGVER